MTLPDATDKLVRQGSYFAFHPAPAALLLLLAEYLDREAHFDGRTTRIYHVGGKRRLLARPTCTAALR